MLKIKKLITEFFSILEETEISESGKEFHPVYISSCRVMKTKRLGEIFNELKKWIKYDR